MKEYDEICQYVKENLSDVRFYHSVCVAQRCEELAEKYGVDVDIAKLTGIAHDIAKEIPNDEKIQYCRENNIPVDEVELINPGILHAKVGADMARKKFEFTDEMCNAIECHTTGKENMTTLDKILYIADMTGKDRSYFPDLQQMIEIADKSLDECCLHILEYELTKRLKERVTIHHSSFYAFNDLLRK